MSDSLFTRAAMAFSMLSKPLLLAVGLSAAALSSAAEPIRVASKIDTEGGLLGHIIVQMLESNNLPVENKVSLGTTNIVRSALVAGEIDIYPEYTGNGAFFSETADDPAWKNHDNGFAKIKAFDAEKNNIVWLKPAPANNTWAIAITKKLADANGLQSFVDFAFC